MNDWERINLFFTAGSRPIKSANELSLAELLLANQLPPSLFQAYQASDDGSVAAIPITTVLGSIPEECKVVLRCMRNTDIDSLQSVDFETLERDPNPVAALLDSQYGRPRAINRIHLLGEDSLRDIVCSKISAFLTDNDVGLPLVAGISGGGDSSTLVQGMLKYLECSSLPKDQVVCFTLVMENFWPESAARRARELCSNAGFQHRVLYPADISALLRMSESPVVLWEELSKQYGSDTSHFFGTFLVNLVGRGICEEVSGDSLCLGYNREDIMAELLFCLMNGRRPLPFPVRRVGSVNCVFPVWDIPKNLLDGCYPQYSERNYSERVDSTTVQRSSIYFIAHCLDALVPQLSISLMRGVEKLMNDTDGWQELSSVPGTPLVHTGIGEDHTEMQILDLLGRFFPNWQRPC